MSDTIDSLRSGVLSDFSAALAARDVEAVYRVVTPDFLWRLPIGPYARVAREIRGPDALAKYLAERDRLYVELLYHDKVAYHSGPATFVTFRVSGKTRADGSAFDVLAMERYLFAEARIAEKDAYWKRIQVER